MFEGIRWKVGVDADVDTVANAGPGVDVDRCGY